MRVGLIRVLHRPVFGRQDFVQPSIELAADEFCAVLRREVLKRLGLCEWQKIAPVILHKFSRFNNTPNILRFLYEEPTHNDRKCG